MTKIEKKVALPERKNTKGASIYPFPSMDIGDSVFIAGAEGDRARACAYQYGLRNGKKFSVRRSEGGYRVWRTA